MDARKIAQKKKKNCAEKVLTTSPSREYNGVSQGDTPPPPPGGGGGGSKSHAKVVGTVPAVTLYYYKVGGCISTACSIAYCAYLMLLPNI